MPRAYVYVLRCKDTSVKDAYLGYTTNWGYTKSFQTDDNPNTSRLYTFIRLHGGWDNWNMLLVDTLESREDALARKIELFDSHVFTLNTRFDK
jgi:hypothetical protein